MKQPAAYYLLLLYCSVLMRCAMPVACDALSHIFNEEEHIATIHAVFGSNHVEKEVASEEKDNNKNQTSVKNEDQVSIHLPIETPSFSISASISVSFLSHFVPIQLKSIFLPKHIPPPKFS